MTTFSDVAGSVAAVLDCDVAYYSGHIRFDFFEFSRLIRSKKKRPNVLLMLTTLGGDPDVAYQMTRCLQRDYTKVTLLVATLCKSAGSLVAVGAHELVMCDSAELGPLDVQLRNPEEFDERTSGLAVTQALSTLREEAYFSFEQFFVQIRKRTMISTRTAAEIAQELTVGLLGQIYRQIEPLRLGENDRSMRIGEEYGSRLLRKGNNLIDQNLDKLISAYPSHEFVIDREEAKKLFRKVREPTEDELALADFVNGLTLDAVFNEKAKAKFDIASIDPVGGEHESKHEHLSKDDNPAVGEHPAATPATGGGEQIAPTEQSSAKTGD